MTLSLRRPVSGSSSGTAPPAFGYAPSTEEQRRPRGPASGPDAGMQQRPSSARDPSPVATDARLAPPRTGLGPPTGVAADRRLDRWLDPAAAVVLHGKAPIRPPAGAPHP